MHSLSYIMLFGLKNVLLSCALQADTLSANIVTSCFWSKFIFLAKSVKLRQRRKFLNFWKIDSFFYI